MGLTAVEMLEVGVEVLETPGTWTQDNYAKDINGVDVYPESSKAKCFCATGLLIGIRNLSDSSYENLEVAADAIEKIAGPYISIVFWNDHPSRTQKQVRNLFLRAIKIVKKGK